MNKTNYQVIKRVNNNTVVALNAAHDEVIIMGKGIGFQRYPNDEIFGEHVERVFTLDSKKSEKTKIINLIESLSEDVLLLSKDVIDAIESKFEIKLNPLVIFNLADHLDFAIEREKQGIKLKNPLEQEIKLLYPREFAMAKFAIDYLNENMNLEIESDELSFITMHFVNSGDLFSNEMSETVIITKITADIVSILEEELDYKLDYSGIDFTRLTTHFRFLVLRQLRLHNTIDDDFEIFDSIVEKFPKEFSYANKFADYLKRTQNWIISKDEILYLTVHLIRITKKGE